MFKSKGISFAYVFISYLIALVIGYFSFRWFHSSIESLFWSMLLADVMMTTVVFVFSVIVRNSSIYEPYWSVIPPFILTLWLIESPYDGIPWHLVLVFVAVCLWAIRLTANWAVNWQGLGHEDWRYVSFRNKVGRFYWLVSYAGFHLFPTLMVYMGLLPLYYAVSRINQPHYTIWAIGLTLSLLGILVSFSADYSLYHHRRSFRSHRAIRRGLWKYSRHPNYLGELTFWLSLYIIALSYSRSFYFTGIGFILMVALFLGYSIPAMEKRLLQTKPDYTDIIYSVPLLIPIRTPKQRRIARSRLL